MINLDGIKKLSLRELINAAIQEEDSSTFWFLSGIICSHSLERNVWHKYRDRLWNTAHEAPR